MASLEPVYQKIAWAKRHYDVLDVEARRYLEDDCCELVIEIDPKTNRSVQRLKIKKPIPHEISLIIGDVIHSLRCSLDYLTWQLVLAAGNEPQDFNQFPICTTSEAFASATSGKRDRLLGIPKEARALIESVQPYVTCKGIEERASLYALQYLSNRDKHRRILLTVARGVGWNTMLDDRGVPIHEFPAPRENGAETFVGPVANVAVGQIVKVDCTFIPFIALDEGLPMDADVRIGLHSIFECINTLVLPKFHGFFV